MFLRVFQHLLPSAQAWRLPVGKTLRRFFEGLAAAPEAAREYIDSIFEDAWPATTRELPEWEKQHGLPSLGSTAARRQNLTAAWQAVGGSSALYIQQVLQAAGFALYVHESFPTPNGPTYVPRDPRDYTVRPRIGRHRCKAAGASQARCKPIAMASQPRCNAFLANEPGYLVNKDLSLNAPPRVPDDSDTWPHFIYVGGQAFPSTAVVAAARRDELERLILKIRQTHLWIVMLVAYSATGTFDPTFDESFD